MSNLKSTIIGFCKKHKNLLAVGFRLVDKAPRAITFPVFALKKLFSFLFHFLLVVSTYKELKLPKMVGRTTGFKEQSERNAALCFGSSKHLTFFFEDTSRYI